ncbi:MAG: chromosomal replication initiator protein DnaA [Bacteroidales bacterium]|nr:chromosomal replication initiator protein DnaA [Bacteroidales bacterium]
MTAERHIQIWDSCLRIIGNIVEPQQFNTWFKPIIAVGYDEEKYALMIEVPSDFFREYLEENYLDVLQKTLKRQLGSSARLIYKVRPVRVQPAMTFPAATGTRPVNSPINVPTVSGIGPNALVFPGTQIVKVDPHLNPSYSFENLVEGECNKMGINVGGSISKNPGRTAFNPLFIFGGSGLGKTHLAQAIGLEIKKLYPEKQVLYVPANRFKTQYMDAAGIKNKLTDFLAFYQRMDVLIVDDIQELSSPGTQNAFFNIFNNLHLNGKQLIFTSDRSPAELEDFEARLLSRLKWGLSVELGRPDYKTRLEMLRTRAFREGVNVDEEVLEYLARKIQSNFRELEGAFTSLMANAVYARKDLTIQLAESITSHIVSEKKNEITIDKVQKIVCDYFNITREDLVSKSRKRQIVQARQIAMFISRDLINCSLSTIGSEIGGKDHATVLHACTTVADLMTTDRTFKQYVTDIEKMLSDAR